MTARLRLGDPLARYRLDTESQQAGDRLQSQTPVSELRLFTQTSVALMHCRILGKEPAEQEGRAPRRDRLQALPPDGPSRFPFPKTLLEGKEGAALLGK